MTISPKDWLLKAKQQASKATHISLDVFDTALLRTVRQPKDIFILMEESWSWNAIERARFASLRIQAESDMRKIVGKKNPDVSEVTLDQIYERLTETNKHFLPIKMELIERELELETIHSRPHPITYRFYRWALSQGKQISFISDIYLPEDLVDKLLEKAGYKKHTHLFVSSAYGKSKSKGTLFDLYLEKINETKKNLLHIGDNDRSDFKIPKTKGIPALKIPTIITDKSSDLTEEIIDRLTTIENLDCNKSTAQSLGYGLLGPLLLGFVKWLHEKTRSNSAPLVFLSRDGKIIKAAYDKLYPQEKSRTIYILASRRAVNFAAIRELNNTALEFLISGNTGLKAKDYFARIDIPEEIYKPQLQKHQIDANEQLNTQHERRKLYPAFKAIQRILLKRAATERKAYIKYLHTKGITQNTKELNIIDIGWHGSIQKSLSEILHTTNTETITNGFYLGTFDRCKKNETELCSIEGYLIHHSEPKRIYRDLKLSLELVEFLHSSSDATLKKIVLNSNDDPCIEFDSNNQSKIQIELLATIQESALQFIQDCAKRLPIHPSKLNREKISEPLRTLLRYPSNKYIDLFKSVQFSDNFGMESQLNELIPQRIAPFVHPKKLHDQYFTSYWKTALWHQLGSIKKIIIFIQSPIKTVKSFRKK